jgi:2,4-dienoyl-CoA reductase-like NADH-dependent reductase (Old Yellow Enzyme family)/NADPH-dependent 2,4-dienoyl-CoA reductase/sulfur reductase-like enzyme
MKIKNRISMSPMVTNFATLSGQLTERQIKHYEARAKGGAGLIITESCYVHPGGKGGPTRLGLWSDEHIQGFKELANRVHRYDARIVAQIHHAGGLCKPELIGEYPVSCSGVPNPITGVVPRCLTVQEIGEVVAMFGQAARRAKEAGLDGIELHGAHGYLIDQFLSPLSNKRNDRYGGSLSKRMTFLLEVVDSVQKAAGRDFPLLVRYNGDEFVQGGLTVDEATVIARVLEKSGVTALDISAGREMAVVTGAVPQGYLTHLAEAVKKVVDIPVACVGRIREFGMAEEILQSNKADLINLGRPLLADPELPKKWADGRLHEVRRCTSCNEGCHARMRQGLEITCVVNPELGREHELRPAEKAKRVVVIGGGPAGMKAAESASRRGHKVSLYEKNSQLGGQLILAAKSPCKQEIGWITEDLETQLQKENVSIQKGMEVTAQFLTQLRPEVVILATGAFPLIPHILGLDKARVITYEDVLTGRAPAGDRVVVIGGGSTGAEVSEVLADDGKKVMICEKLGDVIRDAEPGTRKSMLVRLSQKGVRILIDSEPKKITGAGVLIERKNSEEWIEADTIVISVGAESNRELAASIQAKKIEGLEIFEIGDCVEPRKAMDAIREGAEIGEKI